MKLMLTAALAVLGVMQLCVSAPLTEAMLLRSLGETSGRLSRHLLSAIEEYRGCVQATGPEDPGCGADGGARALQAAMLAGGAAQVDISLSGCDCQVSFSPAVVAPSGRTALDALFAGEIDGRTVSGGSGTTVALAPPAPDTGGGPVRDVVRTDGSEGPVWLATTVLAGRADSGAPPIVVRLVTDLTATANALLPLIRAIAGASALLAACLVYFCVRLTRRIARHGNMSERQARYLAEHDSLTGLLNRHGFGGRADEMLDMAKREGKRLCLAQIDIDRFKDINDLHGHAAGDEILVAVSDMIRRTFPEDALAARLGGDEFAVLFMEEQVDRGCSDFLDGIDTAVSAKFGSEDGAQTLHATTSIGYAFFPRDGATLFDITKASDLALYHVKNEGRNGTRRYHADLGRAFQRRLWEIDGILRAAASGEIVPHYQPLVNAATSEIEGFEALVRWQHPTLGVLTPVRFAHALRDPAACRAVTGAMVRAITADLARWRKAGPAFSVGLNVTEADLMNERFLDEVVDALDRHDLPRRSLAIEVTERAVNRFNMRALSATVQHFRDQGMFVALDDFGTDGSSLSVLKQVPCTAIKIDKSFVRGMTTDADDFAIVRSLVTLAHDLGLKIVAEGVETDEQRAMLLACGADLLQGHLFCEAVPAEAIDGFLRNWRVARILTSRAA